MKLMIEKINIKLKEFKSDISQWLIDNIIILKLKQEAEQNTNTISSNVVEGFSAKILSTEQDRHSLILRDAISDNSIFNIALSGPYGSGKTSIIKTFKNKYSLEYIDISLATFDDKFTNDGSTLKLEYCILKQLFYKVHPDKVPESRFKRIVNHKGIGLKSFLFFCWLLSILYFTNNKILNSLTVALDLDFYSSFFNGFYSIFSFVGFIVIVYKIYDFLINFKMTKFKFNEAELESKHDKATLNFENEIDEILYFFERNPVDVVFFEDLDRFNNTEIYIKLREINFLINNYEPIKEKGKVTFVYAVIDDIFSQNERTKFFDFILPVVPIINYTNSAIELIRRFQSEIDSIENVRVQREFKNFIEKVSLYLSDMRVIISIANEYKVYKNILNLGIDEKKLFAMMVYKNVEPTDFDQLNNRRGYVYGLLKNKPLLIGSTIQSIEKQILSVTEQIDLANKEEFSNIKELRTLYIAKFNDIVSQKNKHSVMSVTLGDVQISLSDLVKDENFETFMNSNPIRYFWYSTNNDSISLSFTEIEKAVNPLIKYSVRLERLKNKVYKSNEELKLKVEESQNKIKELNSKKLSELLINFDRNEYFSQRQSAYESEVKDAAQIDKKVCNYDLINFLLGLGYIDEDYEHYISRQDGNLSKEDRNFLLSFNSKPLKFNVPLKEFSSLLSKIDDAYFYRKEILNFSFMDYLIENNHVVEINKVMTVLKNESLSSLSFIDEYLLSTSDKNKNLFIKYLSGSWTNIFNYLQNLTDYSFEKKSTYLRLLFSNLTISKIKELNKEKSIYSFLSYSESLSPIYFENENNVKVEQFLRDERVYFEKLVFDEKHIGLLRFIYENNLYEINFSMITLMISVFKKNEIDVNKLNVSNYTTIAESGCEELLAYLDFEIEYYLENVLFELEMNSLESEQSILHVLNDLIVSEKLKIKLIEKNQTLINKLLDVKEKGLWSHFFTDNKLKVSWQNVIDYFKETNEIDDILTDYLDQKEVYEILSKENVIESDEEKKKHFIKKLIHSNISNESLNALAIKISYHFDFSELEDIEEDKIEILIKHDIIPFSVENFEGLIENHEDLITIYSGLNKTSFFEKIDEFVFTSGNISNFMKSTDFNATEKLELIQAIDESLIINDRKLQAIVCDFLANQQNILISDTLINSLLQSTSLLSYRVTLFNKYYKSTLSKGSLNERLNSLGTPFNILTGDSREVVELLDTTENNQFHTLLHGRLLGIKKEKNSILKMWPLKNKI
jgi:hypothetical protein